MNEAGLVEKRKLLLVPQGEFELERYPPDDRLQAWDAADEFLLHYLDERQILARRGRVLLLNDAFGALAVALADHPVFSWSDSRLSQLALRHNLRANGYADDQVRTNSGIDLPAVAVDYVLIRIPKMLALLEHQLFALRANLHHDSRIIAAGMARHIHSSTLELFERIIGPTSSTRARKKSRLLFAERDHSMNEGQSRFPVSYELEVDRVYRLSDHASLFSRGKLDRGSRLLLEHMPCPDYREVVDLGCGNGVLGIIAAAHNPSASLLFCDESYMAIASARENFQRAFAHGREADFRVADGLQGVDPASRDLVLLNPPFHQQHSIGDTLAWRLFKDARRVLRPAGRLYVVGNRHLAYHAKLKKLFGNCTTVASDGKFVVLAAART